MALAEFEPKKRTELRGELALPFGEYLSTQTIVTYAMSMVEHVSRINEARGIETKGVYLTISNILNNAEISDQQKREQVVQVLGL